MHQAVWNWLQTCPHIADLFFNISMTDDGDTQLVPSETVKATYIDGSSERYYDVALNRYVALSDNPNDTTNIDMTDEFEKVTDWIRDQFEKGNLPVFPTGMTINTVEIIPSESGFMVSQDENIGKYMLQFRIEYFRSK